MTEIVQQLSHWKGVELMEEVKVGGRSFFVTSIEDPGPVTIELGTHLYACSRFVSHEGELVRLIDLPERMHRAR